MEQNYYNKGRKESKMKKIKTITIILAIILITLIAFVGIYIQTQNRMENKVKDYQLSRELEGGRIIEIKPVENIESDKLTVENYQTIKNTIEKRLKNLGATDFVISVNNENGVIRIELPEDENTDLYAYYITAQGQVQIKEKDTDVELLSDSMVKSAKYNYISNSDGYQTYVEIELTKEGQAKIEEIANNYAILSSEIDEIEAKQEETEQSTDETTQENETETEETVEQENQEQTKKIAVLSIGTPKTTAESEEDSEDTETTTEYDVAKIEKNKITINIGSTTTNTTSAQNNMSKASEISMLISSGKYPIVYEIDDNRYEFSSITNKEIMIFALIILTILLIMLIVTTIKYKKQGLLVSISYIGFVAIFSLLLRYTNVLISIEGILAIILILVINFRFNENILKARKINMTTEVITNAYKTFFIRLIPIMIVTIVFCFSKWLNLSGFGMVMFWGIILIAIYNVIVTKTLLKLNEGK